MRTIVSMLHQASQKFPNRAYATKKGDGQWIEYSYTAVDEQSDYVCAALASKAIKSQSTFGLLAEGRPEWIIAEMGVIKHKSISVPLSIKLTPEEIAFRLTHSEAVGIIASSNTLDNIVKAFLLMEGDKPVLYYLDEIDEKLVSYAKKYKWKEGVEYIAWSLLIETGKKAIEKKKDIVSSIEATIEENDTINICYTSGTTGNPKGIMLTHLNYWANSHDAVELFNIPENVFETLIVLPVDHSFAHTVGIYTSMLRGITLHFVDARGSNSAIIRNFPKNLVEVNPTFLMTVPSISGNFMKKMSQGILAKGKFLNGIFTKGLEAGIARNGDGFHPTSTWVKVKTFFPYTLASLLIFPKLRKVFGSNIQYCVGGGALLEARQQHFFAAIGVPVYQGYGLTEAAPIISSNSPSSYKFGTSGRVAPTVTCKIMKSETEEAKTGERGEIVIKGENVMKGYFKNKDASDEVLKVVDGETWLFTGDLGYYDQDGFLVVTGRAKALLIAKDGEKYSPEEVEEAIINTCDIVNQLLVYNDHSPYTAALVTLQEDKVSTLLKEENIKTPQEAYKKILELLKEYEEGSKLSIPGQWMPSTFAIIEKPFSEADKLVNSTMKLVRYKVIEYYSERVEQMYGHKEHEKLNIEVIKNLFFKD
ncbi:MAG: AMP-dependent synthetase [Spirochaetia bacterium]|nr:AMP-dependent synthetase [Spirochaetia bacterium]